MRDGKDGQGQIWGHADYTTKGAQFDTVYCAWQSPPFQSIPNSNSLGEWGQVGSVHQGGLFVLMGDGAVRFISENIDDNTRINLSSVAGGEVLGEF